MTTTTTPSESYRLRWLDYSRGFTILIIVYSHLRNTLIAAGMFQDAEAVIHYGRIITACTMPMFFFMSGNFILSAARRPMPEFVGDKLQTLAYPYFLWSSVYFLASYALGFHSPHWSDLDQMWTIVYAPRAHMWFFYALFCMGLLFAVALKLGIRPFWFLIISVAVHATKYLGVDVGNGNLFEWIRDFLPYFALGALVNRGGPLVALSESPMRLLVALIVTGYGISAMAVLSGWNDIQGLNLVPVLAGAVAMMSAAIALERTGRLRVVSLIGRHSMEIYVAHVFGYQAVRVLLQHGLGVEHLGLLFLFGMIGGVAVPLLLVWISRRLGLKYLFSLRGFSLSAWRRSSTHAASGLADVRE